MSYGHAEKVAAIVAREIAAAADRKKPAPPIDPRLYDRPDVRRILAERDIGALYRVLKDDAGLTQRTIAELTGQSQSEVSEILDGRRVIAYDVLIRIADGLGISRGLMGLAYNHGGNGAGGGTYAGQEPRPTEVDIEMLRRTFLAAASAAALGEAILGTETVIAAPEPAPLPARIGSTDVEQIRTLTAAIHDRGRLSGGLGRITGAVARECARLADVSADDSVHRDLLAALADQHVQAGYCLYVDGLNRHADAMYREALSFAKEVGDGYGIADCLRHAGMIPEETGAPDDAIKLYQIAEIRLHRNPHRDRLLVWLQAQTATALVHLGRPELAAETMNRVRETYAPADSFEAADLELSASLVALGAGDLDRAEPLARSALAGFSESRGEAFALTVLASAHRHERNADDLRQQATRAAAESDSRHFATWSAGVLGVAV